MLYETLTRADVLGNEGRPVNLQVGHGTVTAAHQKFPNGKFRKNRQPFGLCNRWRWFL